METICQIMIAILGAATIWLLAQKKPWAKWGFVAGLIAEPFWLYTAWTTKQWGILIMVFVYAVCYIMGIRNYFYRNKK